MSNCQAVISLTQFKINSGGKTLNSANKMTQQINDIERAACMILAK
jgi:hypothetical protein